MPTLLLNKPDLEPHFKTLGLNSPVAYKLWCGPLCSWWGSEGSEEWRVEREVGCGNCAGR
ncbi:MAG: hypothetical protein ACI8V2_003493 [Candidatus Latescibacterota bacterium]|jgi:hypothetical protein